LLTDKGQALGIDLWPQLGGTLGNIRTQLEGGLSARIGYHLPERLPLGPIGPAFVAEAPWSVYATTGISTRAVLRNIFLDGNTFRDSARVDRRWWVTDTYLAAFVQYGQLSLGYQWITRSKEFFGQEAPQKYGVVSITMGAWF
jgi:hypothetical protein